jgi:hypothetical protein
MKYEQLNHLADRRLSVDVEINGVTARILPLWPYEGDDTQDPWSGAWQVLTYGIRFERNGVAKPSAGEIGAYLQHLQAARLLGSTKEAKAPPRGLESVTVPHGAGGLELLAVCARWRLSITFDYQKAGGTGRRKPAPETRSLSVRWLRGSVVGGVDLDRESERSFRADRIVHGSIRFHASEQRRPAWSAVDGWTLLVPSRPMGEQGGSCR